MVTTRTHAETAPPLDDAECIRESLERPDAFRALFSRHHARVRRYVVSRVGSQVADDVVADTFLAAFRARSRFDASRGSDALPWLLGVATRVLARHRDAERRWIAQRGAETRSRSVPLRFEEEAGDRADAALASPLLAAALRQLPPREREPLLLHVLGELTYDEIGAALQLRPGTVASRISRGRTRLAKWMEER